MSAELKPSWLVQRLNAPRTASILGADNPFSFGGGLRNGGLSAEAMDLLRDIFSFDYMGAAEFEFGAVPKALSALAQNANDLTQFTLNVPLGKVPGDFRDKSAAPSGSATLFVLCRKDHAQEVNKRIRGWSTKKFPRLKETLRLTSTLRPFTEWDGRTVGWLELDNGFFFFTDQVMWEKTCSLFGVTAAVLA